MTSFNYEVLWLNHILPLMGTIYDKNSSLAYTLSHLLLLTHGCKTVFRPLPHFPKHLPVTLVISPIALRARQTRVSLHDPETAFSVQDL
jgi:hypothetical protein